MNRRTAAGTYSGAAEVWLEVDVLVVVQLKGFLALPLALLPFRQVVD